DRPALMMGYNTPQTHYSTSSKTSSSAKHSGSHILAAFVCSVLNLNRTGLFDRRVQSSVCSAASKTQLIGSVLILFALCCVHSYPLFLPRCHVVSASTPKSKRSSKTEYETEADKELCVGPLLVVVRCFEDQASF